MRNTSFPEYGIIDEYREEMRYKLGLRVSIAFILVFIILTIVFINEGLGQLLGYLSAMSLAVITFIHLTITKSVKYIFVIYGISGSIIAHLSSWYILETTHYVDFIWIIICTLIVYLGGHKKIGHLMLVLNTLGIAYFIFFRHNIHMRFMDQMSLMELGGAFAEILLSLCILTYLMFQFVQIQEFTDREIKKINSSLYQQNQIIEKQNSENVTLLKEIHHRVKNNLQIIVSLLRLQKNELNNEESSAQFQEAINRVLVMSSIHQKLYQQSDLINVNLNEYLNELITELKTLFDNHHKISITIDCRLNSIDLKTMVPVGLLINELLSNSFKYAFNNRDSGKIKISIFPVDGDQFNIIFKDDGEWLKEDESNKGFGLELIEVFTNQLNGERTFETDESGTTYIFELQFAD